MSDTLEFSSNLCIPEDAFEKFQAISMYTEPAQITLVRQETSKNPDSPQNNICGLVFNEKELIVGTEIEINTILSESNPSQEENQNSNNSQLDTCVTEEQLKEILEQDNVPEQHESQENNIPQPSTLQEHDVPQQDNILQPTKKRNSRRKRCNSVFVDKPEHSESYDASGLKSNDDSEEESLMKKKRKKAKKARSKPKPKTAVQDEVSNAPSTSLVTDHETTGTKRIRTRPKRYASLNEHSYDMPFSSDSNQSDTHRLIEPGEIIEPKSVKNTKKKSQRKSTKTSKEPEENHADSFNTEIFSELCDTLQLNPVKPNVKSKSKSKIKILSDVRLTDNDDVDNMTLSQIKHLRPVSNTGQNDLLENNTTHNSPNGDKTIEVELPLQPQNISAEKPKGRPRGRPRKDPRLTPEKEVQSTSTNHSTPKTSNESEKNNTDNKIIDTINSTIDNIYSTNHTPSEANTSNANISEGLESSSKRNTKMPIMSDFVYNIDSVLDKDSVVSQHGTHNNDHSFLEEDPSKRPVRKKGPVLRYQEESDEDPYANIELSDDDELSWKSKRYNSDYEYVPGRRESKDVNSTDSEATELIDEAKSQRKKRVRSRKSDSQSPRKKTNSDKQNTAQDINSSGDVESCLLGTVVRGGDDDSQPSNTWGGSYEFENFIAKKIQGTNLNIKKVSLTNPSETRTFEIPVIDPEAKKTIEMCTQTNIRKMVSTAIQTSSPYDNIPMKENIALTAEQSKNACDFLCSIIKTTSELGTLMTEKSEEFIKKKINTTHVNDTMKVDYCVKKSFLLLNLAKHNLMQMEEDLGKQYELFLNSNGLKSCREAQREIFSTPNEISSGDSDCEIVEGPIIENPVRNKVLSAKAKKILINNGISIRVAKNAEKKITKNFCPESRENVFNTKDNFWLSKSVLVKKLPNSTQSFLAQDSRNKKPPDNKITTKMVSDFFKNYNHQRVLSTCAPFVTTDWLNVNTESACNYFVVKPLKFNNNVNYPENGEISMNSTSSNTRTSGRSNDFDSVKTIPKCNIVTSPETLFKMCYRKVRNQLHEHSHVQEVCQQIRNELTDGKKEPVTLFQLSLRALTEEADNMECSSSTSPTILSDETSQSALPLKKLCYQKVVDLLNDSRQKDSRETHQSGETTSFSRMALNDLLPISAGNQLCQTSCSENSIKSLLTICVEFIQRNQVCDNNIFVPKTLKSLTLKSVQQLLYKELKHDHMISSHLHLSIPLYNDEITTAGLTINSVNTLSEEAFLNLEQSYVDTPDSSEYFHDFDHEDHYESEFNETEDTNQSETNWVSQVQLKELRSCVNTNSSGTIKEENIIIHTQIKMEPVDDLAENVDCSTFIKIEPVAPGLDEMAIFPGVKPELDDTETTEPIVKQNRGGYNMDPFEEFITSNDLSSGLSGNDIYSQSALRVRRQHEPDYYEAVDTTMSLLVPQTYEPLNVDNAKGSLMESSSDEDKSKTKKVPIGKKKVDRRNKGKNKKLEQKLTSKDIPVQTKEKTSNIEVANLTKKMRDRITQEEERAASTDSDNDIEDLPLRLRRRKDQDNQAQTSKTQDNESKNSEIQCNNVDSTDKVDDVDKFTGFTATDQNEISTYQNYMKFVYDKIIPQDDAKPDRNVTPAANASQDDEVGEVLNPDAPIELLECEPTMPIFDDIVDDQNEDKHEPKQMEKPLNQTAPSFVDRHGWHCYPLDPEDTKLYLSNYVVLEKLPETFFQTYLEYQDINLNKNDADINRLTNLTSLTRTAQAKEGKSKKSKKDATNVIKPEPSSGPASPAHSDHYEELEPSDDEGTRAEDEIPPPVPQRNSENTLAKNLLMDDNNSDADETVIKQEPVEGEVKKTKVNSKAKIPGVELPDDEDLMLTADKMMTKELTLLHAPVLPDEDKEKPAGPATRNKQKSGTKNQPSGSKIKGEEDSSSEEEKQWVTTKEKLLKRLCKKDGQVIDDAKRAKLVTEFIERRADCPDGHHRPRQKSRRTNKKYLERQKQLRVLSRELFGEPDPSTSKRSQASLLYKGRRNIRKVIDKKSLARSTVVANMEEFERKRRLNARQAALRERLGCEEGVNVLVINDEVCLEYDFEANRPIVTVHSFFTKVMKAHQYEGVKFMWDACFESVSELEAGRGGGGCILAHCMGLGKTLQVLALLHTVLTHPRVGIKRVLVVCPLSTVLNWVDEIHKWIGPVTNKIKVFELSKLKKTYERAYQLEDWYNGGGIFIIGYELFRSLSTLDPFLDDIRPTIINKIRTALLDPGPDIIVCDEGHLLKNDSSVLSVAMSRVVTKRRIILTGTPMQNNLREYYCMVNFVKPNLLGTYAEYSNRFENPIMNGQHRDSREEDIKLMKARTHILHKVLEGCLQRQEASVLYPYLPKKHEYTLFITQTACQWKLYKHYLTHYGNQTKQSILKDFHILQKIWSHPQVLHNFQTKAQDQRNKIKAEKLEDDLATEDLEEIKPNPTDLWWLEYLEGGSMLETLDSSNKFVVVFRILDECIALGDKVLIFSTSLFCLDALEYFLKKINKWSLGQEYYRLDGSVPAEVRQKWCREFNADNNYKTKLFLVSTRAGCLGLNMTAANRVIIMDTSWNPAHDIQSIFRVYRFGQKKDCFIYRLVAMGTMEQKIYERSVTKQAVACRVVDEQQIDRHYNMADLTELYKFDELGSSVAGGVAVGVADVALLRVARLAALHAVHEHDSLLRDSSEPGLPEHERNAAWMQFQQEQTHRRNHTHILTLLPPTHTRLAALHAVHEHDSLLRDSSEPGLPEHERNAAWMQFQQEQTHRQIENELVEVEVSNTGTKRLHGHDYAMSPAPGDVKTEDKSEDFKPTEPKPKKGKKLIKCCIPIQDSNDIVPEIVPDIKEEPTPTTSKDFPSPDPDLSANNYNLQEEIMVEKITSILIKHNFQNKKGGADIGNLVAKVRNLVIKGHIDNDDTSDELTASIANILLPKRVSVPAATDIMCESINNSAAPCFKTEPEIPPAPVKQKPGPASRKKTAVFRNETEVNEIKPKRRAAIQAEKHIDSLVQDVVIDLDDDDNDSGDADFVPAEKPQITPNKSQKKTSKNGDFLENANSDDAGILSVDLQSRRKMNDVTPNTNKNLNVATPSGSKLKVKLENKKGENQLTVNKKTKFISLPVNPSDSILLSDDDEEESITAKEPPKTSKELPKLLKELKTAKKPLELTIEPLDTAKEPPKMTKPKPEITIEPLKTTIEPPKKTSEPLRKVAETPVDDEIVPLPIAILKNQNFINIVAHTYLSGNPMLDVDAAKLAAQYSTLKAYDEVIRTGKDVCSGPIYDIAVKVIGKDVLKKMRAINDKAVAETADTSSADTDVNKRLLASQQPGSSEIPPDNLRGSAEAFRDDVIKGKFGANTEQVPKPTTVTPVPRGVVPGNLVQLAENSFGKSGGESILPDSENTITSDQIPAKATVDIKRLAITPSNNSGILKQTLEQKSNENKTANSRFRKILSKVESLVNKVIVPAGVLTPAPAPAPGSNNTANNYICLDSDEEDPVQPAPSPAPTQPQVTPTPTSSKPKTSVTPVLTNAPLTQNQAASGPVPVSLSTATAPGESLPLPQDISPAVTPTRRPPLVLKQVVTTGLHRRYVLVPPVALQNTPSSPDQPPTPKPSPSKTQQTPVSLLRVQHDTKKNSNQYLPVCKKEDLVKISKSGTKPESKVTAESPVKSIDLTDKLDKQVAPSTSKPSTSKHVPTVTVNLTEEVSKTPKRPIKKEQKQASSTEARKISEDSSSSSNDSLSIFKDVIQIQASDYSDTPRRKQIKQKTSVVKAEKSNNTQICVNLESTNDKRSTTVETVKGKKLTQVPQNKVPKHIDAAVKIKIEGSNKSSKLKKKEQDIIIQKAISNFIKPEKAGKSSAKKGSSSKAKASTSSASASVDLTNLPVTYASPISILATKRQSSTGDKSTAKKKKTTPMSLKDFDLDDFDDIIELE
ncbi:unnamed protein product [Chrysodeixis includens]|uniref:Uncharacterized protein n=1 Tax=Chrysodeixis includens TaxID=689277 RepID=A0A9P0BUL6_CHRIL|nr:unnamed protein product [Chrysodeixis includens]